MRVDQTYFDLRGGAPEGYTSTPIVSYAAAVFFKRTEEEMTMQLARIGTILQWGYAVKGDIQVIAEEYASRLGVGPFFVTKNPSFREFIHKGEPQEPLIQTAIAYWGDVQIELSQCTNDAKTHHMLGHRDGLHHVCVLVDDLDETIERFKLGDRIMQRIVSGGGQRNIYIESYIPGGYHLEIAEKNESTERAFNLMKEAALHWDGTRPVREITELLPGR